MAISFAAMRIVNSDPHAEQDSDGHSEDEQPEHQAQHDVGFLSAFSGLKTASSETADATTYRGARAMCHLAQKR
ncbi:hypothetical protein [Labedaea rhizosphaerae]|uniref:hypothetical protein n=1 Tax=Labedaea rhizosphaerae TaxID=598644 RepID=UPI00105E2EC8|nr:hypothetical protein [Labedaea rhizosphaerae]